MLGNKTTKKLPKFQIGISRKQQPTTVVLSLRSTTPKEKKGKNLRISLLFFLTKTNRLRHGQQRERGGPGRPTPTGLGDPQQPLRQGQRLLRK